MNTLPIPIANVQEAERIAMQLAQALALENPGQGMLLMLSAAQRGTDVLTLRENYHFMHGQLTKRADAMLAQFQRDGGTYTIVDRTPERAAVLASFGDNKDVALEFIWADAILEPFVYRGNQTQQLAELAKPIEQRQLKAKYVTPRSRMQMLWARLTSDMVRALDPSAVVGTYTPEEVEDFAAPLPPDGPLAPIGDAEACARATVVTPTIIDYSVCPIGGEGFKGRTWTDFDLPTLEQAKQAPGMEPGHYEAIAAAIAAK